MQTEREKERGEFWDEEGGTFSISFDLRKVFYYLKEHAFIFRKFWNLFLINLLLLPFVEAQVIHKETTKDQRWNGIAIGQNVRESLGANLLTIPSENLALVTLDTCLNLGHFITTVKKSGRNIETYGGTTTIWNKVKN